MTGKPILLEQVVYGSFAFSDRGYAVLARSPGVRDKCLVDLLVACQGFGEAPHHVAAAPALFSLPLGPCPRAVVGVFPQGCDDRGRPGALAFHALLIADRDFRRAGGDPFAFAPLLRGEWTAGTSALPPLSWRPGTATPPDDPADDDPRVRRIVAALARGRRVALESDAPIDALARRVWARLPEKARHRASVATWAFGNENRFDLVALPRLSGVPLDASYLLPGTLDDHEPAPGEATPTRLRDVWRLGSPDAIVAIAVALAAAVAFWPPGRDREAGTEPQPGASILPDAPDAPLDPAGRARSIADLAALAGRFGVPSGDDPAELMTRFAAQVRYRGPSLTPSELARLAAEVDPDRDRALVWHDRLRRFAEDRPLPDRFRQLALERQLALFAWSYHLPRSDPARSIPRDLDDALSREGPITPTPLAARYPALSDYARFLMRLPRRNDDGRP